MTNWTDPVDPIRAALVEAMAERWQQAQREQEWKGYDECINGLLDVVLAWQPPKARAERAEADLAIAKEALIGIADYEGVFGFEGRKMARAALSRLSKP